ncbi:hypothetical protein, partial [Pelagicoccus mobilis]|uniref:hypothetical protein n=1 Tax=Pelagicoccus mobilis TaxID=415221 RepID=UPI001F19E83F
GLLLVGVFFLLGWEGESVVMFFGETGDSLGFRTEERSDEAADHDSDSYSAKHAYGHLLRVLGGSYESAGDSNDDA